MFNKLTDQQRKAIQESELSNRDAAKEFGVSYTNVCRIRKTDAAAQVVVAFSIFELAMRP